MAQLATVDEVWGVLDNHDFGLDAETLLRYSAECLQHALAFFEHLNPGNATVRRTVEAVRQSLDGNRPTLGVLEMLDADLRGHPPVSDWPSKDFIFATGELAWSFVSLVNHGPELVAPSKEMTYYLAHTSSVARYCAAAMEGAQRLKEQAWQLGEFYKFFPNFANHSEDEFLDAIVEELDARLPNDWVVPNRPRGSNSDCEENGDDDEPPYSHFCAKTFRVGMPKDAIRARGDTAVGAMLALELEASRRFPVA